MRRRAGRTIAAVTHVLLTGAGGFVGAHVLRHLLAETDWTVACPVTFRHRGVPPRITSAVADLPAATALGRVGIASPGVGWDRVDVVHCDLAAPLDGLTRQFLGWDRLDVVLNVASESHVDRSLAAPVPFVRNNVDLVLNLLEAVRRHAPPTFAAFVQVSTDEVYGPAPADVLSREWDPVQPSNPYAASKAAQEAVAFSYWRSYGVPLVITNTMNLVGEMQDPEKFMPSTLRKIRRGERIQIHAAPGFRDALVDAGPTIGSRFYLHARNQADALLLLARTALAAPEQLTDTEGQDAWSSLRYGPGAVRPPRFNVVGERELTNLELAAFLRACVLGDDHETRHPYAHELADPPEPWYELVDFHSSRPGHDLRYALDGAKLERVLGWKPPVPLLDSLRKTVEWTLNHPEWLDVSR